MISPTLFLDELMQHPQFAEAREQIRAAVPVHLLDQLDAATDDVYGQLHAQAATQADHHVVGLPTCDVPDWIRLGALDAMLAHCTRRADTCMHAPDPSRPEPVIAAAWRPGLVACGHCTHLFALPRNSPVERTCDACGRVVAGVEADDPIYPAQVQLGPLRYMFGTCDDCRPPFDTAGVPLAAPDGTAGS